MSEAGSDSGGISSHDGSKNDAAVIIIRNPRSYQQFLHPSTEKVVAILYLRDINCNAYNDHKVAGDNLNISAVPQMQQCSINIVSLNEDMALNLNEHMFLK